MISVRVFKNIITKYSKNKYTKLDLLNKMKRTVGDVNLTKTTDSKKYVDCAKIDLRGHVDRY